MKQKEGPVIIKNNAYAGGKYENCRRYNVEEIKFIQIPNGNYLNQIGMRGGLQTLSLGIENLGGAVSSNIFLFAIYLGGQFTSQALVKTKINNDVIRYGAGFTRLYADLLVFSVINLGDPALTTETEVDGAMGWRVRFQWYVSPHNRDYHFLSSPCLPQKSAKDL